jgi:hypothetical protein
MMEWRTDPTVRLSHDCQTPEIGHDRFNFPRAARSSE